MWLRKLWESLVEWSKRWLIQAAGGLVVIQRDGSAILWFRIVTHFDSEDYSPKVFRSDICSADWELRFRAVEFAQCVLSAVRQRFGDAAELGKAVSQDRFHRVVFVEDHMYYRGTVQARPIRIKFW